MSGLSPEPGVGLRGAFLALLLALMTHCFLKRKKRERGLKLEKEISRALLPVIVISKLELIRINKVAGRFAQEKNFISDDYVNIYVFWLSHFVTSV